MSDAQIHSLLCALEWFLAPLTMYLLLFKWRDRLNILHMPWADLVALLVIADVALTIHVADVPDQFESLAKYKPVFTAQRWHWIAIGFAGLLLCRAQIKWLENRIRDIVIRHMTVGWPRFDLAQHFTRGETVTHPKWRAFCWLWSASVAITALVIATHVVLLGARFPQLNGDLFLNRVFFVGLVMLVAFAGSWVLCISFVLSGYCRLVRHPPANGVG